MEEKGGSEPRRRIKKEGFACVQSLFGGRGRGEKTRKKKRGESPVTSKTPEAHEQRRTAKEMEGGKKEKKRGRGRSLLNLPLITAILRVSSQKGRGSRGELKGKR